MATWKPDHRTREAMRDMAKYRRAERKTAKKARERWSEEQRKEQYLRDNVRFLSGNQLPM